ncbi:YciI family protein [Sphingomonas colocasiae]|uniref:YciI family protein n=1 Tax=Sphingomonas colocasiae TaxID=1848973 RepID=A0ABS7PLC0_9SPHN|nr:YciI family protein [Sphingomonas colocasiae]MBY8820874.1 YciI family protein [Sphingomonas colocasiae]
MGFRLAISLLLCLSAAPVQAEQPASIETNRSLFAIVYRPGPAWKAGVPMAQQGLGEHARYMKRLVDEGVIHTAGPLGADGGLVLLHARDLAAAQSLMAADPAVLAGLFAGEVRPFAPRFTSERPLAGKP